MCFLKAQGSERGGLDGGGQHSIFILHYVTYYYIVWVYKYSQYAHHIFHVSVLYWSSILSNGHCLIMVLIATGYIAHGGEGLKGVN